MIKDMKIHDSNKNDIEFLIVCILADMLKYEKSNGDFKDRTCFSGILYEKGMPFAATELENGKVRISRAEIETVYKSMRNHRPGDKIELSQADYGLKPYKILLGLEILSELHIINSCRTGLTEIIIMGRPDKAKKNLAGSVLYRIFGDELKDGQEFQ
jgi:hypothetical protein